MADCCSEGTLDLTQTEAAQRRVLIWVLLINLIAFGMMVAASIISGSSALLSGTLDNLGDAATYALSLAVIGASNHTKAKVALFKGALIVSAAIGVAIQIGWRLTDVQTPLVGTMSVAATLNLAANGLCLMLLAPHRHNDINMSSVWECSRNDVFEGTAVIVTAAAVWFTSSGWPDIIVAIALLVLFARSAARVLRDAWRELQAPDVSTSCASSAMSSAQTENCSNNSNCSRAR